MAKQQAQQDGVQESELADSDTDVDIDGVEGAAPKLGMQDMRGLNSKLTKLATTHSIHLLQKDQLVLLLGSLGAIMQQGESLLIGTNAEEDAQQQGQIMMSLEACTACLQILAAPGMPKQVYKEELIDRLVGFVRFQLMHNVLVFHDAALCQAQRPGLLSPDEDDWGKEAVVTSKKKTPKSVKKPVARQVHALVLVIMVAIA